MASVDQNLDKNHLPVSTTTVQGHLHKQQQHLQSTKSDDTTIKVDDTDNNELDIFPAQPHRNKNVIMWHIY